MAHIDNQSFNSASSKVDAIDEPEALDDYPETEILTATADTASPAGAVCHHSKLIAYLLFMATFYLISTLALAAWNYSLQQQLFHLTRDTVGRQDFALRYNGGKIIGELTTQRNSHRHNEPDVVLDEDLRPGRCWLVPTSPGQIGVTLSEKVVISAFTIDHVQKELVSSMQNAPCKLRVWGITRSQLPTGAIPLIDRDLRRYIQVETERGIFNQSVLDERAPQVSRAGDFYVPLGVFEYSILGSQSIQTFGVLPSVLSMKLAFDEVVLEVLSNWGAKDTCLYRFRVHGNPPR